MSFGYNRVNDLLIVLFIIIDYRKYNDNIWRFWGEYG